MSSSPTNTHPAIFSSFYSCSTQAGGSLPDSTLPMKKVEGLLDLEPCGYLLTASVTHNQAKAPVT